MAEGTSMRLKDRIAVVTGGASGFGEGIVRRFVEEGARVAIADLNLAAAQALATELGEAVVAVQADVSQAASVAQLGEAVERAFGAVDVLVNNAGAGHTPRPME